MMEKNNFLIKFSAAGNKFLLADKRWFQKRPPEDLITHSLRTQKSFEDFENLKNQTPQKRKSIFQDLFLHEKTKLTDGLIVVDSFQSAPLKYEFYNRDGSQAEMCGNAACCLIPYSQKTNLSFEKFQLGEKLVQAQKNSHGNWACSWGNPPSFQGEFSFSFEGQTYLYHYWDAGVPHAVLAWEQDFNKDHMKPLAQQLRNQNPLFKEKGMNVSFYQLQKEGDLRAISFERGVEDFTLGCGTGALSVAFAFARKSTQSPIKPLTINMPGGKLTVEFSNPYTLFSPMKWGY